MRVWRLARQPYCTDRAGTGSKLRGGRWTPPGIAVIHAAGSIALAALEVLVQGRRPPPDLMLVAIDLPEDGGLSRPGPRELPEGWASPLTSEHRQAWGRKWCETGASLALAVPSVIVPEEPNYLINVAHPRMKDVRLKPVRRFAFDLRLLRTQEPRVR